MSPVLPGFLFRPLRATQFSISVLGELITYAQFPTVIAGVCLAVWICSYAGAVVGSDSVGSGDLLSSGVGVLCRRSSYVYGGLPVPGAGPAGLSVPVRGGQWTAVLGWKSSVWLAASSSAVSGVCGSARVGSPVVPFADVLGGPAWKGISDGGCHQPAAGHGHNVVQPSSIVTVRHVATPYVIRNDGLGHRPDGVQAEVADLSPAPRAARAAKYMSAMGPCDLV